MSRQVLGVIGGLGPLATAIFLEELTKMTEAPTDQDNLDMIVYNFPSIPDRTGYILGSNLRSPLPGLLWAGRELERQGVSAIAIPCVTAHYFYPQLSGELSAPILHGIRETAAILKAQGVCRVGILATEGTLAAELLTGPLVEANIQPVLPEPMGQQDVNHLIYRNIKAGLPPEPARITRVQQGLLAQGTEVILLGCTELSVLRRDGMIHAPCLDMTQVLAGAAIDHCGKKRKPEYNNLIRR